MIRFLLTPVGSSGDVFPYIGIGRELRARGHGVTLVGAEPFGRAAAAAGLDFVSGWSTADFERVTRDPDLWHPQRGMQLVFRTASANLRNAYELLASLYEPGRTVIVGHALGFPARLLEDVHGGPAATLQLAPSAFRSEFQLPAVAPGVDISWMPRWAKRALWWLVDSRLLDPGLVPALNELRADLGLTPVRRVFRSWIHSPRMVLGLFPEWFGPRQPDWPSQLRLTGFPRFDVAEPGAHDEELDRFLSAGDAPIAFTPGSANRQARAFFTAALEAAGRLGRRAVLLTRYREQLPDALPDYAHHTAFVPLERVLPRCAAVVHHGGIGTCAQGLAAGIPQVVMPMGFDQPDNVMRLARLGVGACVTPRSFTARNVSRVLGRLLRDEATREACTRYAHLTRAVDGVRAACDALEELSGQAERG